MSTGFFSFDNAFQSSVKYFNGDDLAAKVWLDKYALKDSDGNLLEDTPDKMHQRIAKEFARIEKDKFKSPLKEDEIFKFLDKFKYLVPQGSPMYGIGNPFQIVSLSNCFVTSIPEDSYSGILQTDFEIAQISKRRGGVGTDLSNLRPAGSLVKNAARSSTGITSWMQRYSHTIREVGQNNRRGALMLTISVHHPDAIKIDETQWDGPQEIILEGNKQKDERDIKTDSRYYDPNNLDFCSIKLDRKLVTGANVSIRLTDEFLLAVKNGEKFEQRFPVNYKEKGIKPTFSQFVDARKAWEKIIHCAWQSGEPGLIFWDNIVNKNAIDCYAAEGFNTVTTNPCQPLWAEALTKDGIRQLKDIFIGDYIWSIDGWTRITNKQLTGIKKVYEYRTTSGVFYGTENHRLVSGGEKVEAKDCESIDSLIGEYQSEVNLNIQDIIDGLVIGDGISGDPILLCIGQDDADYFNSEVASLIKNTYSKDYCYKIQTTIKPNELPKTYLRSIPDRFYYGNKNTICGFLRGLYTANGSICRNRVTLKAASFKLIEQVQRMLSSIGIKSYFTTNKSTDVKFSNGTYTCKQSYDLNITNDREKFYKSIGFIQQYKTDKLQSIVEKPKSEYDRGYTKTTFDIISTNLISEELVCDITVNNQTHTYWTGGVNVSNCSELPLCSFDSCRLLVQNLFSYVDNPFTEKSTFNFNLFTDHAVIAQRLMDDLIDLELEKIDGIIAKIESDEGDKSLKTTELNLWRKIKEKCFDGRRTGLGVTATGDTLAALGIPYGSEQSIEIVEKIHKTQKLAAVRSSVEMAKETGSFPIWDWEKEKNSEFLLQIKAEDVKLYKDIEKYGRKNIGFLTIAPVGSASCLTQTTSGMESLFSVIPYKRRKKINYDDKSSRVDFVDANGDKWQEFEVYHPKVKTWMDVTGKTDIKESPWYGSCANDINWKNRVRVQAVAQRHIDHAISSTINLPFDVTEAKVAEIYQTAWESGCKGITVYREGCRSGVLINKNQITSKTKFSKRPKELKGEMHHFTIKGIRYYVVVGMSNGEPYEIFTGCNHDSDGEIIIPKTVKDGLISKESRGRYHFVCKDATYHLTNGHNDQNADALTRMISTALRHGSSIGVVVHQLEKTRGEMTSFAKVLARSLKKYIQDGEPVYGENCSNCGGAIVRENACKICKSCGASTCS